MRVLRLLPFRFIPKSCHKAGSEESSIEAFLTISLFLRALILVPKMANTTALFLMGHCFNSPFRLSEKLLLNTITTTFLKYLKMNKIKHIYLFLIGVLLLSWSVRASEIRRVVSLAPSLTKNLKYLEAEDLLVGCTSYCQPGRKVDVVASAVKVNIEKVVTMKPDLIIATTITDPETIGILRKFGFRVEVFPKVDSFENICSQFLNLGKIIGKDVRTQKVIADCKKKVEELKQSVKSEQKPKMFLQIGADPLYTVMPKTFMDDYITFAGAKNIASDLTVGSISRESVLLRNPDVIFIVTMGIVGEEEKATWEKVSALSAAKNKKIFIIDSDKACTPTPISFVETLETIINLTYGK